MISALKRLVATNDSNNNSANNAAKTEAATSSNPANAVSKSGEPTTSALASPFHTTTLLNNGMQMISQSLQKKFSRGVNYNSKEIPFLLCINSA
jgi:hypothetical protein